MRILRRIVVWALLSLSLSASWAGDAWVDNLNVTKNAYCAGDVNVLDGSAMESVSASGLEAWWKLDEMTGTTAADSSGNGHTGTRVGNPSWVSGRIGGGLAFVGGTTVTQYVDSGTYFSGLTGHFSVALWVYPSNTQVSSACIVGNRSYTPTCTGMAFEQDGANLNSVKFLYGDGTNWTTSTATLLASNLWQHLAAVFDGSYLTVYVDGIQKSKVTAATGMTPNSGLNFMLGQGIAAVRGFAGRLDDVRVYSRALSSNEVNNLSTLRWMKIADGNLNVTQVTVTNSVRQTDSAGTNYFLGKFGVGTAAPAEAMHVVGNLRVDGTLSGNGAGLTNIAPTQAGALAIANNLSDVPAKATARSNLGLGSAATNEAGAFLSPAGDGSQLAGITADQVGALSTNGGVVAGDVQVYGTQSVAALTLGGVTRTDWPSPAMGALMATNNLAELYDAAAARSHLGLGSAAVQGAEAFDGAGTAAALISQLTTNVLMAANNLAELDDAAAARSHLGLGSAAVQEAEAFDAAGTAAALISQLTAEAVGALSTNGGVVNGAITMLLPAGDIPMGAYTNGAGL